MFLHIVIALAATAQAHPSHHKHPLLKRATTVTGIATFNDYGAQGNTNCGPTTGQKGAYGAAASDISPDISGGACSGSIAMSQCAGQSPSGGYAAPTCPKSNCGKCYKVTNRGGLGGGSIGGIGNSVIVQIIDACPASSAYNFCKTDMPANERCSDHGTNQLDIDKSAYMALTGQAFGSGPTLNIGIEDSGCLGAATISDQTVPGGHSAGGDKKAENVAGMQRLAVQNLEPGAPQPEHDGSPTETNSLSTESPPQQAATSSAVPGSGTPQSVDSSASSDSASKGGAVVQNGEDDDEDEECDEL